MEIEGRPGDGDDGDARRLGTICSAPHAARRSGKIRRTRAITAAWILQLGYVTVS